MSTGANSHRWKSDTPIHFGEGSISAGCINKVTLHWPGYSTGMGHHLWVGTSPPCVTSHQCQLSLLPSAGREMSTDPTRGDALWLRSKGRHGSFHLWMNVWVAGKTVWSLVNTCHTWVPQRSVRLSIKRSTGLLITMITTISDITSDNHKQTTSCHARQILRYLLHGSLLSFTVKLLTEAPGFH